MNQFFEEVVEGLSRTPKRLNSKYFYDAVGDDLFQKIMACNEYYLTRCETEIFKKYGKDIAVAVKQQYLNFDLIELGAGDASKTLYLLRELMEMKASFTYVPIDISANIIQYLEEKLPIDMEGLKVKGFNGEYLNMLQKAYAVSTQKKVILLLGSNIGNLEPDAALAFFKVIRAIMQQGDQLLIGFDLKKDPATILAAYNDAAGYTKAFNLNLLNRINKELGGNFIPAQFEHYPTYDPLTGTCKSYLISKIEQKVGIGEFSTTFCKDEPVFMEVSQKYSTNEIVKLAEASGFVTAATFFDNKRWFVDALWKC